MKTYVVCIAVWACWFSTLGQTIEEAPADDPASLEQTDAGTPSGVLRNATRVIPLDADARRVEPILEDPAQRIPSYIEVGTGLQYQNENGQWLESQDLIELMDDGSAAALRGRHKVTFEPNLNTDGAVSITTASNRVFRTHVLARIFHRAMRKFD